MGEINISFKMNLKTGLKDIVIEYDSDEDMMRHEHEKKHRDIVKQLVGEGLLNPDELGDVTVERVQSKEGSQASNQNTEGEAQASGQ
ncbi:MAG: hypothetical protein P1V97_33015 [Planctomycetota bacterium]|nr:hypothetical protein [Planctomycetota bacterium]